MDPAAAGAPARAARLCADPAATIRRFKALTGRKAVGHFPPCTPSEVIEAAGMLPVAFFASGARDPAFRTPDVVGAVDGFALPVRGAAGEAGAESILELAGSDVALFRFPLAEGVGGAPVVDLLDGVEAFAEWASSISGAAVNEGELHRAIRSANRRRRLWARLCGRIAETPGLFSAAELLALARCAALVPTEAHSGILEAALSERAGRAAGGGVTVFVAGVASLAAMGVVDLAGASVCGSFLSEEAALREEQIGEEGDAALCLARAAGRRMGMPEESVDPWRRPGRIMEMGAACGAGAVVLVCGAAEAGAAGAFSVEGGALPVVRIPASAGDAERAAGRLREGLEGAAGRKGS